MANITGATAPIVAVFESAQPIRIIMLDGEPWFLAADVCSVLGYANGRDALAKHCRAGGVTKRHTPTEECDVAKRDATSKARLSQEMTYINEGNLYRLVIKSRMPAAEKFEAWVCDEVLPSIRKTGSYSVKQEDPVATDGEPLTQEQLIYLKSKVSKVSHMFLTITRQKVTSMIYRRIKSTFRISRTDDLPQCGLAYAEMMLRMIEAESRRHWSNTAPVERKILSGLNLLEMEG